ncbi:hypothetical protein KAS14_00195 [Candidatus Bathyarchaeota archaeon]|nr:hypothetical protein [Candidatus Bathyarchaeota archaeon]
MRTLKKQGFKLPYLGKEIFIKLTRMGLDYEQGIFLIRDLNNIENIRDFLSEILNEKTVFTQICLICRKDFLCTECKHYSECPTKDLPLPCICEKCSQKNNLYEQYLKLDK